MFVCVSIEECKPGWNWSIDVDDVVVVEGGANTYNGAVRASMVNVAEFIADKGLKPVSLMVAM